MQNNTIPRLTPGTELVGEYQDSGLIEPTFLVRNPHGQMLQLSKLLFAVLSAVNGTRPVHEIALVASTTFGREITPKNVEYLVDNKLKSTGLIADAADPLANTEKRHDTSGILVLKARLTLLPEHLVNTISRAFAFLFAPPIVILIMTALIAGDIWLATTQSVGSMFISVLSQPTAVLAATALAIGSMTFHELGHAAACKYGGAKPGKIGMGIYVVWPAFYTNVTDSYRLSRRGRLRVDLGGVYFNAVFCTALLIADLITHNPLFVVAMVLIHGEILQQLLPTLRLDGHLILSDLIGVPDLFNRIGPALKSVFRHRPDARILEMKRTTRLIVSAWALGTTLFIAGQLVFLAFYGQDIVVALWHSLQNAVHVLVADFDRAAVLSTAADTLALIVLLLPLVGSVLVTSTMLRQLTAMAIFRYRNKVNQTKEIFAS